MEKLENTPQVTPFIQAADNERLINVYCAHIYLSDTINDDERKMYEMEFRRRGINIAKELSKRSALEAQNSVYKELQLLGATHERLRTKGRFNSLLH